MSAETLRKAAALMRERAEAATKGPWVAEVGWLDRECGKCDIETPDHMWHSDAPFIHGATGGVIVDEWNVDPGDAPHIASWHPAVALAAALGMECTAESLEMRGVTAHIRPAERAWIDFARAYLGGGS